MESPHRHRDSTFIIRQAQLLTLFRISATYGIRTTSDREILYFNDHDTTGDRVFISNGKRTNTRRDREREK